MSERRILRLGTRRSALAWVQSSQVAASLRAAHPGLEVELVGIDTRGDRIQDVPLTGIEGKEFFTAEIDAALLEGRVDITVHSLKDLSLTRPAGAGARRHPAPRQPARHRDLRRRRAGPPRRRCAACASAPRRRAASSCCHRSSPARCLTRRATGSTLLSLRGNVDSRLRRLHEPRGSERHLDGVVLAFAGPVAAVRRRRDRAPGPGDAAANCCAACHLMVLPLTEVPGAPGQGALAIECRADDARTRALLAALEHPADARGHRLRTRAARGAWRRLPSALRRDRSGVPGLGGVLHVGGDDVGRAATSRDTEWLAADRAAPAAARRCGSWDGSLQPAPRRGAAGGCRAAVRERSARRPCSSRIRARCRAAALRRWQDRRVWTSGSASWFRLAAQGVWVEGCAEGRGAAAAAELLAEPCCDCRRRRSGTC